MVCHICGEPASSQCSTCHRCMCNEHFAHATFFGATCTACVEKDDAEREDREKQREERAETEKCYFCGRKSESGHPRCAVCGRHFCAAHGKEDSLAEARSEASDYTTHHVWRRCYQHPR